MLNWISNFYYFVVTLLDETWRAARRLVGNWKHPRMRRIPIRHARQASLGSTVRRSGAK